MLIVGQRQEQVEPGTKRAGKASERNRPAFVQPLRQPASVEDRRSRLTFVTKKRAALATANNALAIVIECSAGSLKTSCAVRQQSVSTLLLTMNVCRPQALKPATGIP